MKDRKTLMMTELVTEVIKQLLSRFGASPTIIKRAIDRLIEREFLERDEIVRSKLRYMVSLYEHSHAHLLLANE